MADSNDKSTTDKIHLSIPQLTQFTDEFYELFTLHWFLYDAIEGMMTEMVKQLDQPPHSLIGLGQVLSIVRQREQQLRERLKQIRG